MIFPVGVKNIWYKEYKDLFMIKQFLATLFSVAETKGKITCFVLVTNISSLDITWILCFN